MVSARGRPRVRAVGASRGIARGGDDDGRGDRDADPRRARAPRQPHVRGRRASDGAPRCARGTAERDGMAPSVDVLCLDKTGTLTDARGCGSSRRWRPGIPERGVRRRTRALRGRIVGTERDRASAGGTVRRSREAPHAEVPFCPAGAGARCSSGRHICARRARAVRLGRAAREGRRRSRPRTPRRRIRAKRSTRSRRDPSSGPPARSCSGSSCWASSCDPTRERRSPTSRQEQVELKVVSGDVRHRRRDRPRRRDRR